MDKLRQLVALTAIGFSGIPKRLGPSAVIVVSVASVVAVMVCVIALAQGFFEASTKAGRPDRAIVLGAGAISEATSRIPQDLLGVVLDRGEIRRGADRKPVASEEVLVQVPLNDPRTDLDTIATLRGVGAEALALRPDIRIVNGRMFRPGLREVVVGQSLLRQMGPAAIGTEIVLTQGSQWTVVGTFTSDGDSHESELLTDSGTLMSFLQRNYFNSITVALNSAGEFDAFKNALSSDPRLQLLPQREDVYFKESTQGRRRVMEFVVFVVGGVMALGAALAAVNAMYSVANKRSTEIATLRALGFDSVGVVVALLLEALLLAFVGAIIGAVVAWTSFNGSSVSPLNGFGAGALAFSVKVTAGVVATGMAIAFVIGLLGGFFPARRAASLPVAAVMTRG